MKQSLTKIVYGLSALGCAAVLASSVGAQEKSVSKTISADGEKQVVTETVVAGPQTGHEVRRIIVKSGDDGETGEHQLVLAPGAGGDKKVRVFVKKGPNGEVEEVDPAELEELTAGDELPGLSWKRFGEGGLPGGMTWIAAGSPRGYLGVQLSDLTPELRTHFGADQEAGVLVGRVEPESPADRAGVLVGDVIVRVGDATVASSLDVIRALAGREAGDVVDLELVRDGRRQTVGAAVETRKVPQMDVRHLIHSLPGELGNGEVLRAYDIDVEALNDKMKDLDQYFESPEWKQQLEQLEHLNVTLEKRLENLQIELDDLEKKIDVRVEIEGDEAPDEPN